MSKRFRTVDCFCVVFVSFCSFLTRIWLIADPDRITFDEVHFGNFTNWYIQKRFHFDIHPPLGKLIMASIARMTGYKGDIEYGAKSGEPYARNEEYFVSQRITCAIFSAFTSPLMFAACRCFGLSTVASLCAGIILTCDISLIVEGKFILSDGLLHFFVMLHVYALGLYLSNPTQNHAMLAGATLGAAVSCKYTALGLVAVMGVTQLLWILRETPPIPKILHRAFIILFPAATVFVGSWYWHFLSTPFTGPHSELAGTELSATLINKTLMNSEYWGRRLLGPPVWYRIIRWNILMHKINMKSAIPHPCESYPLYWPLFLDKWVGFLALGETRVIRCMATPFIYWFAFAGIVLSIIAFPFGKSDATNALFIWGWSVSYFPFFLVPRTLFLYHYLIPLMFAIMNLVAIIERVTPRLCRVPALLAITLLSLLCFLYFSPWCYGTPCPNCHSTRIWTNRWWEGPPKPPTAFVNTTEIVAELPL